MSNSKYFFGLLQAFIICFLIGSCKNEASEPECHHLTIVDRNWTEGLDLQASIIPSKPCIHFTVKPGFTSVISIPIWKGIRYEGVLDDHWTVAERFAIERISDRSRDLVSFCDDHFSSYFEINSDSELTTLYMKRPPYVYADKSLFGMQPGEDLTSFFVMTNPCIPIKAVGLDYEIIDTEPAKGRPLAGYFTEGTILPLVFYFRSLSIPEELSKDNDINLTIVFPVLAEHYWTWLLELSNNQDAKESFTEMEMTVKVNLKDIKVFNPKLEDEKKWIDSL